MRYSRTAWVLLAATLIGLLLLSGHIWLKERAREAESTAAMPDHESEAPVGFRTADTLRNSPGSTVALAEDVPGLVTDPQLERLSTERDVTRRGELERVEYLTSVMSSEVGDHTYARTVDDALSRTLAMPQLAGVRVSAASCGTSFCRFDATFDDEGTVEQFRHELMFGDAREAVFTSGGAAYQVSADGELLRYAVFVQHGSAPLPPTPE